MRSYTRTVWRGPDRWRAEQVLKLHAQAPVDIPYGPAPLTWRVLKESGELVVRGYSDSALEELARAA